MSKYAPIFALCGSFILLLTGVVGFTLSGNAVETGRYQISAVGFEYESFPGEQKLMYRVFRVNTATGEICKYVSSPEGLVLETCNGDTMEENTALRNVVPLRPNWCNESTCDGIASWSGAYCICNNTRRLYSDPAWPR